MPVVTGMNRHALAAGAAALLIPLAACGSDSETPSTSDPTTSSTDSAPAPASGGIVIDNFSYSGTMTVKAGASVTVTNDDTAAHTVTDKAKGFDSGSIEGSGGKGTFTAPTKAGSYPFGCTFHPSMAGTLVVS